MPDETDEDIAETLVGVEVVDELDEEDLDTVVDLDGALSDDDDEDEDDEEGEAPPSRKAAEPSAADDEDGEDEDEIEDDLAGILDERLRPDRDDPEDDEDDDEDDTGTVAVAAKSTDKEISCPECFTTVRQSQVDMRTGEAVCPNCGLPMGI